MLVWYQQDNIGAIRDDIVNNKLTLETLPHSELVLKYYLANVWHNDDVNGNVFNLEVRNVPEFICTANGAAADENSSRDRSSPRTSTSTCPRRPS